MKKLFLVILLAVLPSLAVAESKNELLLNGMVGNLTVGSQANLFVAGGYNYAVVYPSVQLGFVTGLAVTTSTNFSFLPALTVNLLTSSGELRSSFFLTVRAGINLVNSGLLSNTYFEFDFAAGKRFPLLPNFNYRPELGLQIYAGTAYFIAKVLSFSVLF